MDKRITISVSSGFKRSLLILAAEKDKTIKDLVLDALKETYGIKESESYVADILSRYSRSKKEDDQ